MNKIQEFRTAKGVSKEDLAKAVNVTRRAVDKWEASESSQKMQLQTAIRLADYFECDIRDLCF